MESNALAAFEPKQPQARVLSAPAVTVPVYDRDFALLAFGKCKRCWGAGFVNVMRQLAIPKGTERYPGKKGFAVTKDTKVPLRRAFARRTGMVNEKSGKPNFVRSERDPQEWERDVCPCALKRFPRLQATYMDKDGALYYAEPIGYMTDETRAEYEAAKKLAAERADAEKGAPNAMAGTAEAVVGGGAGENGP